MHHLAMYTAAVAATAETDLTAASDGILAIQNNHFLPQRPFQLWFVAAASALLTRARVVTPSARQITTPFIRPISVATNWGMPQRIDTMEEGPLELKQGEEISALVTNSAATSGQNYVAMGLGIGTRTMPAGQIFTLRGTSTSTATANAWTTISVTWQDVLPVGTYAVVGGEFFSSGQVAGRLIFEGQSYRPGALGITSLGNSADNIFRNGGLGEWGRFTNYAAPNVEVFCSSADTSHDVYLDIVKVA
jgi:hypothetical protein